MPFEINHPLLPELNGTISTFVTEVGGVSPTGILEADKDAVVNVSWQLTGPLTPYVAGHWLVSIFLESMGPGPELRLPIQPVIVPLNPQPSPNNYSAQVLIPANSIPQEHRSVPYKLVTTVTYRTPGNQPGPMAGFVEGQVLQFYVTN